jgi:hypothetical protein
VDSAGELAYGAVRKQETRLDRLILFNERHPKLSDRHGHNLHFAVTMKIAIFGLLAALPVAGAFAPSNVAFQRRSSSPLSASAVAAATIVTGPKGKPAANFEEDLMLTLQVILDHDARSTTVSKEQFISQMEEVKSIPEPEVPVDLSIPYDAAARLAYDGSDKSLPYGEFKAKYEADTVAMIKAKQPKRKETAAAPAASAATIEGAAAAAAVDLSIPYDAAARLAYEASDKSISYEAFKPMYEAEAVAQVISKKPVDLSIPYDAAAVLAYKHSDRSMPYSEFKAQYEADAVAQVVAKKKAGESS